MINLSKTRTQVFGSETTEVKKKIKDKELENVTEIEYLGMIVERRSGEE